MALMLMDTSARRFAEIKINPVSTGFIYELDTRSSSSFLPPARDFLKFKACVFLQIQHVEVVNHFNIYLASSSSLSIDVPN